MGFSDLAKKNNQIEQEKEEKNELLTKIKDKLYLWRQQVGKYENLPQYADGLNKLFNDAKNDFSSFFKDKGFYLLNISGEIEAELKNLDLKISLSVNTVDGKLQLYCIEKNVPKFEYNITFKEDNEFYRNSNVFLTLDDKLHFSNPQKKEDISYLKAELETIELDLTKLKDRTRTDFPINFLLYWEQKDTEHTSIIEILEQIEKEYFN